MTFEAQAYLEQLPLVEADEIDLAKAALALAAQRQPDLPLERYLNHLKKLCEEARARHQELLAAGAEDNADTQLAALKHILIDKHDYQSEPARREDINIDGASLIRAIDTRKGLPITLSILYIHVGRALGWDVEGLDIPDHFVCRLQKEGQRIIFDPSGGCRKLEAADLRSLIKAAKGDHAELSAIYFEPVDTRKILIRLQNTIKFRLIDVEDYQGALETVEVMRRIDPQEYRLLLDAGVLYARTQRPEEAINVLESYIEQAPQGYDRQDAALLLQQLKDEVM